MTAKPSARAQFPPPRTPTAPRYAVEAFDENLVLRVPWLLWATMVYAVHAPVAILLLRLANPSGALDYFTRVVDPPGLLAALPGMMVLAAPLRRTPRAGRTWRRIWRQGLSLLMPALAGDLLLALVAALRHGHALAWSPASATKLGLSLFFICVLGLSRRVRDTFNEFPAAVYSMR